MDEKQIKIPDDMTEINRVQLETAPGVELLLIRPRVDRETELLPFFREIIDRFDAYVAKQNPKVGHLVRTERGTIEEFLLWLARQSP